MAQGLDLSELEFAAGRFRPLALLGQGAMGVVYRVLDEETAAEVALKTLHERAPEEILTLKREFRSLADIAHPNLVELYELFVDERACFFTMEFVDGSDAVSAVRGDSGPGVPLDEAQLARLLELVRQLAAGLAAVHQAGKLHRDVKPSNIQVGRDGRLVLLDFGLAIALRDDRFADSSSSGGGSLAYMAPEQAWGRAPHPAADWYSAGVLLYEMLTGVLPFRGPVARMFQDKSRGHFAPLASVAPWAPPFLADLTTALLYPDPLSRPGADEILERLEVSGATRTPTPLAESSGLPPFVGRERELEELQAAAQTVLRGEAAVVEISGASGIGKSELVRRFFSRLDDAEALILHGRCHPQESVPYKALDPILDDLSRFLLSEPRQRVESLVPANAAALVQLFPVLGRVPSFAGASADAALAPSQLRRRGFLALRELLLRVAAQRLVVLWIDDLQWSDSDSAVLLRELLRPPEVPPFLLLLSYRERDRSHIPLFALLDEEKVALPNGRRLPLEALSLDESEELLRRLCGERLAPSSYAAAARESHGSPFFLAQLAFHTSAAPTAERQLSIGEVLDARMATLSESAQDLLETISIAGRPVLRGVALQAAGLSERQRPLLLQLERGHFVRSTAIGGETAVEAYHDRIRESVLERLPPARARSRHLDIARELRRLPEPDPQQLFTHYLGGEDRVNARRFGEEAADRTARALAFARAIDLYRQVLDLHDDEEARARLTAKVAEQLGNSGRGMESAQAFEEAAGALERLEAEAASIVGLKSKAAEQYLRVGRLEQGVAALRPVLHSLGVDLPASRGRVVAKAVQQRFRAWRRGRAYELRRSEDVPAEILQRLELCWGSAMAIAAMDPVVADVLCTRHMIDALDSGVAVHIVKALTHDAVTCAQFGSRMMRKRVDALMREADALNQRTGDPFDKAVYQTALGGVFYVQAEWRNSHENCERALAIMRERFPWLSFEIATFDCWSLTALAQMGELRAVAERLPRCLEGAEERNDLYSAIGFRTGALNLVWLAQDRIEDATAGVDAVMAAWPDEGFHVQHFLAMIARAQAALYRGDAAAAWAVLEGIWPRVRASGWLRIDGAGIELDFLRGRAALALATTADAAARRGALLREARQHATSLARRRLKTARPLATLLRAGLAAAESKNDEARALYAEAATDLASLDMGLHAAVARLRLGELSPGGEAEVASARAWMGGQDILRPERMAQVFAPVAG